MSWMLAIDFGTSNTAAAIWQGDRIAVLRLEGSGPMPSAVALMDGEFRLGSHAVNARRAVPDAFEETPKLLLGAGATILAGREFTARQLVSAVLAQVRSVAITRAGGSEPELTILTHPIAWNQTQRDEFLGAAIDAGFRQDTIRMLPEPIAAAYGLVASGVDLGDRIAIVDWGGGTCDVAVVERGAGGQDAPFTVSNWSGDGHLGGNDLDNRLFASVFGHLDRDGQHRMVERLRSMDGLGARLTLAESVRRAKEDLSSHQTTQILAAAAGDEATVNVTRDEYEQAISGEVGRVIDTLLSALGSQQPDSLDAIVLTGGSASTPALARELEDRTGVRTIRSGDPKLIVVEGALSVPGTSAPSTPPPAAPAEPVVHAIPPAAPARPKSRSWIWAAIASIAVLGLAAVVLFAVILPDDPDDDRTATKTTPTTKTEPDPSFTCWDGSEEPAQSDCPDFAGEAALEWAAPRQTDNLTCNRSRGEGRPELYCEHRDYPLTSIFVVESNTPEGLADMERFVTWGENPDWQVYTSTDTGTDPIDGVAEIYFAQEPRDTGNAGGLYSAIEYADIPVLVWLQTANGKKLTDEEYERHIDLVYRTAEELRDSDELAEVVDYIP